MTSSKPCIPTPLQWKENQPFSSQYDDIYFSQENGLAETQHVFLDANQLAERFAQLDSDTFTIAETGFGTGLNFLCAWQHWNQHAPDTARLHFVSVERFPLTPEDLTKALALWPELSVLSAALTEQYPRLVAGYHRLSFDNGRVTLTLMFGDASGCYSQLNAAVDAWFLDGFAPAKNPDMWQPELFAEIGRLSHSATTFATFTAAGLVKRGLKEVGFEVKKIPGFGRKREMLSGQFATAAPPAAATNATTKPSEKALYQARPIWFRLPPKHRKEKTALIIGAGIAGCATAYALAQRGWQVTVIDRQHRIAQEGSGNRQGALYAKLPAEPIPASRIHLAGFLHSARLLRQQLPDVHSVWAPCGLIQLPSGAKEQLRQQAIIDAAHYPASLITQIDRDTASTLAGLPLTAGGLYFPDAGWVNPPRLCEWLCQHPNIHLQLGQNVSRLIQDPHSLHWQAQGEAETLATAAIVVVTSAADALQFEQLNHLPLQKIRGQVSLATTTPDTPMLKTVLCSDGYISPPLENQYCFGATFDLKDPGTDIRHSGHQHNIDKVKDMAPELASHLAQSLDKSTLTGRVGFRCASPDYLPIIGPAPVAEAFISDYAKLKQDRNSPISTAPQHYPGLFINVAHGSKGLITGPIGGEMIAAMLENEPLPLESELVDTLSPARFIIKKLIKRAI